MGVTFHKFSLSFRIIYSGIFPGLNGNPLSIWVLSRKKDLSPALLCPAAGAGQSCFLRCGQSDHRASFSWGKPSLKGASSCNNRENPLCERPWTQWAGKCRWLVCVITAALLSQPLPRYEAQLVCVSAGGGDSCSLGWAGPGGSAPLLRPHLLLHGEAAKVPLPGSRRFRGPQPPHSRTFPDVSRQQSCLSLPSAAGTARGGGRSRGHQEGVTDTARPSLCGSESHVEPGVILLYSLVY